MMSNSPRILGQPTRRGSYIRNRQSCSTYLITVLGIMSFLLFILIKLPMDINSYAWRSAHLYNRSYSGLPPPARYGGSVDLSMVPEVPVGYKANGVLKQVIITRGQIPHLMNFSRAVIKTGQSVVPHHHHDKDEVFHVVSGEGVFYLEGQEFHMQPGTTVHVAAQQEHRIDNIASEDLILVYFGIDTET